MRTGPQAGPGRARDLDVPAASRRARDPGGRSCNVRSTSPQTKSSSARATRACSTSCVCIGRRERERRGLAARRRRLGAAHGAGRTARSRQCVLLSRLLPTARSSRYSHVHGGRCPADRSRRRGASSGCRRVRARTVWSASSESHERRFRERVPGAFRWSASRRRSRSRATSVRSSGRHAPRTPTCSSCVTRRRMCSRLRPCARPSAPSSCFPSRRLERRDDRVAARARHRDPRSDAAGGRATRGRPTCHVRRRSSSATSTAAERRLARARRRARSASRCSGR